VLPGYPLVLLLALLLIATTPTGTGAGLHQFDLVHPLFAHLHVVNGRVLTHEQMQRGEPAARGVARGPALGAATGSNAADAGLVGAISSDQPSESLSGLVLQKTGRTEWPDRLPLERREAPPDPPPTPGASTA
jgi:uncharacterized iron-regulated membrane protein